MVTEKNKFYAKSAVIFFRLRSRNGEEEFENGLAGGIITGSLQG